MQTRYFSESNIDKIDRLMGYLKKQKIEYNAHWVGLTPYEMNLRHAKVKRAGKEFDEKKVPLMQITWFE